MNTPYGCKHVQLLMIRGTATQYYYETIAKRNRDAKEGTYLIKIINPKGLVFLKKILKKLRITYVSTSADISNYNRAAGPVNDSLFDRTKAVLREAGVLELC